MSRLFLDCDDVLADFERGAHAVLGMPSTQFQARFGPRQFWSRIADAPDFFAKLPLLPDAKALFGAIRHLKPTILTSLHGGWADAQKRAWLATHFPGVPVITTQAARKWEHCRPGDALVEDRSLYKSLWEQQGGVFIRHRDALATLEGLRGHGFAARALAEPARDWLTVEQAARLNRLGEAALESELRRERRSFADAPVVEMEIAPDRQRRRAKTPAIKDVRQGA